MAVTLDIKGAKGIDAALAKLPLKVQGQVLGASTRDGAKIVLAAAKANAPVQTGALLKSVKVRAAKGMPKGSKGVVVGVGAKWFVGDTYYGAFVEFGHRLGKRPGKGKLAKLNDTRKKVEGKHFIERAYEATAVAAVDEVIAGIRRRIDAAIVAAAREGGTS